MLLCPPVGGKCFQKWTVIICLVCDTAVMAGLLSVIETVVRNWCVLFGELLPVSATFSSQLLSLLVSIKTCMSVQVPVHSCHCI